MSRQVGKELANRCGLAITTAGWFESQYPQVAVTLSPCSIEFHLCPGLPQHALHLYATLRAAKSVGFLLLLRLNKYRSRYAEGESRYGPKPNVREAVEAYVQLAADSGLTPVQLAIRCVGQRGLNMQVTSSCLLALSYNANNCQGLGA